MKAHAILIMILLILPSILAKQNFWNSIVYVEGKVIQKGNEVLPRLVTSSFYLQILSDHTFQLVIQDINLQITGKAIMQRDGFSLNKKTYTLISDDKMSKFKGKVQSEIDFGIKWTYFFEIPQKQITCTLQEKTYYSLIIVLTCLFAVANTLSFSIYDAKRDKILHNLNKRCYLLNLVFLAAKQVWVTFILLLIGILSCFHMHFYLIAFEITLLIFSLLPSVIHLVYFLMVIQKKLAEQQFFLNKIKEVKLLIESICFFSPFMLVGLALFVHTNIYLLYVLTISNILQFVHTYKEKVYAYRSVLFYDFVMTFILSLVSLFMPIINFTLVSYKEIMLFWNFYLFILIFGLIYMKKSIKGKFTEIQSQAEGTVDRRLKANESIQQIQFKDQVL